MKNKKLLSVLICALTALCCLVAASCSGKTAVDDKAAKGYTLTVKFDLGGGVIGGADSISLMDMYRPADYTADENGDVHIKLVNPTDGSRPNIGYNSQTNPYPLTNRGHLLIGWYSERTQTENGGYEYSGRWDFSSDKVTMKRVGEKKEITLYAAWTEFFEFDFYSLDKDGNATLISTQTLNVIPSRVKGTARAAEAGIFLPYKGDVTTVYKTDYDTEDKEGKPTKGTFEFPQVEGKTFKAAYEDKERTKLITTADGSPSLHKGSVDEDKGISLNTVQNIYVEYEDGVYYDISTPEQLAKYADNNDYSVYRIKNDLDFTDQTWPAAFSNGAFKGKISSADGEVKTIKKVTATVGVSGGASGLFAEIASGASIIDLAFDEITVDFALGEFGSDTKCGLISGNIAENAMVELSVTNATVKVGFVTNPTGAGDYEFDLVACGNKSGVTVNGKVRFVVHCNADQYEYVEEILYGVNPADVTVSEEGKIKFKFLKTYSDQSSYDQPEYEVEY